MVFKPISLGTIYNIIFIHTRFCYIVTFYSGLQITLCMQHDSFIIPVVIKGQLTGMLGFAKTQRTRYQA
ncbi:hypothetical protein D3C79_1101520 [compost metagenome]